MEQSVEIFRPTGEVFAFVADPGNWPRLRPVFREEGRPFGNPMRVGDRFSQSLPVPGQRVDLLCKVTGYEPDERLSLEYAWNGLSLGLDFVFEPTGGSTRVVGRGEGYAKGFFALLEPVIGLEVDREVKTGLDDFKRALESRPSGDE